MHGINEYIATFLTVTALPLWAGTATITIDPAKPGPRINPGMYGIFLEEINYGVDGGLYPELVANRAFEDSRPPEGFTLKGGRYKAEKGYDSGFEVRDDQVPRWSFLCQDGAEGAMHLETTGGLNTNTLYCLCLDLEDTANGREKLTRSVLPVHVLAFSPWLPPRYQQSW